MADRDLPKPCAHGISRQSVAPQKAKVGYLTWQRQFRVHKSLQSEQHPVERLVCQLTSWPIARVRGFDFWLRRVLTGLNDSEQLPNKPQRINLVVMLAGREAEKP